MSGKPLKDGDYVVEVEIGIGGYHQSTQTFGGSKRTVGAAIKAYVHSFRVRMHESGELHGDLREFAPKMGDNYITYNDYDDEIWDALESVIRDLSSGR